MNRIAVLFGFLVACSLSGACDRLPSDDCSRFLREHLERFSDKQIQVLEQEMALQSKKLPPSTLAFDGRGRAFALGSLLSQPTLVFRYPDLSCNACHETLLNELTTFYATHPECPLIVLASAHNLRILSSFRRTHPLRMPFFTIPAKDCQDALDLNLPPYFFIAGPDLQLRLPHIAQKELEGEAAAYLELAYRWLKEPQAW
jgi:hypothetical protein